MNIKNRIEVYLASIDYAKASKRELLALHDIRNLVCVVWAQKKLAERRTKGSG